MKYAAKYVIGCLLALLSLVGHAKVTTEHFTFSVDTAAHNGVRIDEIDKVINSTAFISIDDPDASAYGSPWLKLEWDKSRVTDEQFLINDFTSQAYEDYYLIKDGQLLRHYSSGYAEPFDVRPIEHFKFVADVSDADYVLVKTCCNPGLPIYFRLLSEAELEQEYQQSLIWYAVVYALVGMMIAYNFFIFLYLRDRQYLYYCYYLFSMLYVQLGLSGIGKQFIWPNMGHTETLYFIGSLNVSIASMLFQQAFLNPKYLSTFNKKLMRIAIGIHIAVLLSYGLAAFIEDMARISNTLTQLVCMLAWLVTDYVIIRNLLAGDRSARILLISYLLINLSGLIFILRYNGILPVSLWAEHIVDVAVLVEALLLSLALAQKIQQLREDKIIAEEKQLLAQKDFSQQLLQVQEEEKKRLSSALHDNFTHQLLVLKNSIANKLGSNAEETHHVNKVLSGIRDLSHVIHPYLLEKLGLIDALSNMLETVTQNHDLEINFASDAITIDQQQSLLVYRIVQEAVNNTIKHADADECVISIKQHDDTISLLIKDDGKGFDTQADVGFGLKTIKERCDILSGEMTITSNDQGTSVDINFPQHRSISNTVPDTLEERP